MAVDNARPDDDEEVDLDERSPRLGLRYRDLIMMNEVANRAADISRPRHVLFYLYAGSQEVGRAMAAEATGRGFDAEVSEPLAEYPDQWLVACETTTVLSADFVRDSVDFFEALAQRNGAEYDGWEAAAS